MLRTLALPALSILLADCIVAHAQAPAPKDADPPFKMECTSTSTRVLPKGNAGAGKAQFEVAVDPAAQSVSLNGVKRKATIDAHEIWFRAHDEHVISISRSTKTFRLIYPIKDAQDSSVYLLFEGACKAS